MALTSGSVKHLRGAAFVCLLAAAPVGAAEAFLNAYRDGLVALEAGEWEAGARLLREAIAARPEAKLRLPRQRYLHPYVPHFYLGMAHFRLGQCGLAIQAFEEATRQGVVAKRSRLVGEMRTGREVCRSRIASTEERRREAGEWTELAGKELLAVRALAGAPEIVGRWSRREQSLADRLTGAEASVVRARELVSAAGRDDVRPFDEAKSLAVDALDSLKVVRASLERFTEESRLASKAAGSQLQRFVDLRYDARRALAETAHLERLSPLLTSQRKALVDVLEASAHLHSGSDSGEMKASTRNLSIALSDYRVTTEKPSAELVLAAEALLKGDYDAVAVALDGADVEEGRVGVQASLLLAAASFNLYLIDGGRDSDLLESARIRAQAARAAGVDPPPRFFSPRFLQFFGTVSLSSAPSGL